MSFIEIYNETVVDLLSDSRSRPVGGLIVRENEEGQVYVKNLAERMVVGPEEVRR